MMRHYFWLWLIVSCLLLIIVGCSDFFFGEEVLRYTLFIALSLYALVPAALFGFVSLPLIYLRHKRHQKINAWQTVCSAIFLGLLLGTIIVLLVGQWEYQQRQQSGKIIAQELEKFYSENHLYPENLSQLNELDNKLSYPLKSKRFDYFLHDSGSYSLSARGFIGAWFWDEKTQQFIYD